MDGNGTLDKSAMTALEWALHMRKVDLVRLLVTEGAKIEARNKLQVDRTPIFAAIGSGSPEMLDLMLARGAKVNLHDAYGLTPLHFAVASESAKALEILEALLAKGADPNRVSTMDPGRGTAMPVSSRKFVLLIYSALFLIKYSE